MLIRSSAWDAAAASASPRVIQKVEVWTGPTANRPSSYLATLSTVVSGLVTQDETATTRRSLTCVMATEGYPSDDLIPATQTDLLHPSSANLIVPYRGFRYSAPVLLPDGSMSTDEYMPLGRFRMTKPVISETNPGVASGAMQIAISGNDLSLWINSLPYQKALPIAANTLYVHQAIALILNTVFPGLMLNLADTSGYPKLPAAVYGITTQTNAVTLGTSGPWADCVALAAIVGFELFFDVMGTVVLRPRSDPTTQPVVASFVEGESCTFDTISRTLDETQEYNGVQVIGGSQGNPAVQWLTVDTDPNSPTYWYGPWGQRALQVVLPQVPMWGQSTASAVLTCKQSADASFLSTCRSFDTPVITAVTNAALQDGDCYQLTRSRMRVNSQYAIGAMTIPLETGPQMSLTARPRPAL